MSDTNSSKDFFISYTKVDRPWAEHIAWCLEEAGYTTIIQAWDFLPGSNFILKMQQATSIATRTIMILSPDYLDALYTHPEWAAAFVQDPTGQKGLLVPVRVKECQPPGMLNPLVYIDLIGLDEATVQRKLLAGIQQTRAKPSHAPGFPGNASSTERPSRFPGALPTISNVPYRHNPYFTGREELLRELARNLWSDDATTISQPIAIYGLAGIGKTQAAVEYVYSYRNHYDAIFWIQADTREKLISDFVAIAESLNLPRKDIKEQELVISEVQAWLRTYKKWLLVLDSADDLTLVREFFPNTLSGHLLLTTRVKELGNFARLIKVDSLSNEQGALLLLRLARFIAANGSLDKTSSENVSVAMQLAEEMEGLPLAIAQAGAYINKVQISLLDYFELYKDDRRGVLDHPAQDIDYRNSVMQTFSLSFEKVQQEKNGAAELLQLFSCLAPVNIPFSIIIKGAPYLGSILQAIVEKKEQYAAKGTLLNYSLISSDITTDTINIHRLLQVVMYDRMTPDEQQQWTKRAIQALNAIFPNHIEAANWKQCQLLLPHVQACIFPRDAQVLLFPEAVQLLVRSGAYLRKRAQYEQAKLFLDRAGFINDQLFRTQMENSSHYYYTKGRLAHDQGDYTRAKEFYEESRKIQTNFLDGENPETLLNLGRLYHVVGKYNEAMPLLSEALKIREKEPQGTHALREKAKILQFLGEVYRALGKFQMAEDYLQKALEIRKNKEIRGPDHPETARTLNDLGALYRDLAKYAEAECLIREAIQIREGVLGREHLDTVVSYHSLARLCYLRKDYERAEGLATSALNIRKKLLDDDHPRIAQSYCDLAAILSKKGVKVKVEHYFIEAEEYLQKALKIYIEKFGEEHPDVATCKNDLAALYVEWGREYNKAKELVEEALTVYRGVFESDHPRIAASLTIQANLLFHEQEYEQAKANYHEALEIYKRVFEPAHPDILAVSKLYNSLSQYE